ncbi:MAG: M60 family metallopeptidase [Marinifilaceae bacterium]
MKKSLIYVSALLLLPLFTGCKDDTLKMEDGLLPEMPDNGGTVLPPNEQWGWVGKFPGEVSLMHERVQNQSVQIIGSAIDIAKTNTAGQPKYWQSTGLYVPPAEAIVVEVPAGVENLCYQIGIADVIIPEEGVTYQRYYDVTKSGKLVSGKNVIFNNFGGHLYFYFAPKQIAEDVATTSNASTTVVVSGAVTSPDFILKENNIASWRQEVTDTINPMIWGELRGENVVLTLPVDKLKDVEHPATILEFYDNLVEVFQKWSGIDYPKVAGIPNFRIYSDVQLYLDPTTDKKPFATHSGYPMALNTGHTIKVVDELLNATSLRSNDVKHIVNMIGTSFMSEWLQCENLAGLVSELNMYYIKNREGVWPNDCPSLTQKPDLMTGNNILRFPDLSKELRLRMLLQLAQQYGWGMFTHINVRSNEVMADTLPEQSKNDMFAVLAAEYAGENLTSFFQSWRFPLTAYANTMMGQFPQVSSNFWETFQTNIPVEDMGNVAQKVAFDEIPLTDTIYKRTEWSGLASSTADWKDVHDLLDGNVNSNWHNRWSAAEHKIYPHWVSFTFDKNEVPEHELEFNYVDIYLLPTDRRTNITPKTCQFQKLNENGDWEDIDGGKYYFVANRAGRQRFYLDNNVTTRGIKFVMLTPHSKGDFEFGATGQDCTFTEFSVGLIK